MYNVRTVAFHNYVLTFLSILTYNRHTSNACTCSYASLELSWYFVPLVSVHVYDVVYGTGACLSTVHPSIDVSQVDLLYIDGFRNVAGTHLLSDPRDSLTYYIRRCFTNPWLVLPNRNKRL